MTAAVRQLAALALACGFTWWLLFRVPVPAVDASEPVPPAARPSLALQPVVEQVVPVRSARATSVPAADDPPPSAADPQPASPDPVGASPPPPEAGSREGSEDGELAESPAPKRSELDGQQARTPEDPDPSARGPGLRPSKDFASDPDLLAVAESELSGEAAVGFSTVFVSAPEDQLGIAYAFGEDVVLVPREALDPEADGVVSYRLDLSRGIGGARVRTIPGRPPLERYRQYRDLFAYDFARLPAPLRELRKAVVRRDRVYLFAALIPPSEWAIVVGRRREALATLQLDEGDVERFVMRYTADPGSRRAPSASYDIRVDEIVLTDGTRHRPRP